MQTQIVQPTKRNTPRRLRDASSEEVRRAAGMGLSVGLGLGSVLSGARAFSPTDVAGGLAAFDLNAPTKITYGSTFKASGTTPPAVTATYGTVAAPTAIRIEVEVGATTFKWCPDNNGTTGTFVTGVTLPVGGGSVALGSTGVTAVFPAGAYLAGQTWQTTLASVTSVNSADVLSQATAAKQPLYLRLLSAVGTPATDQYGIKTDGVDDILNCSTIDLPAPTVGTPTFYWTIFRPDTFVNFHTVFGAATPGTGRLSLQQINGSGDAAISNGAASAALTMTSVFGRHWALFTNTTADQQKWRSTATALPGGATGGTDPAAGICYGARGGGAGDASTFFAGSYLYMLIGSQAWAVGDHTNADAYATARWGSGLV